MTKTKKRSFHTTILIQIFIEFTEGTTGIAKHPAQFQRLHGTAAEASESSRYQTLPGCRDSQCTEAMITDARF